MHAKARHHRRRQAADGQLVHRGLELRHHHAGRGPAQVATAGCAAVLAVLARDVLEGLGTGLDLAAVLGQAPACGLGVELGRCAQQHMARAGLRDAAGARIPALHQLEHMKAGAGAQQRGRDLTRLQSLGGFDKDVRQARRGPQAQLTALGAVGVFRQLQRDLGKVLTATHTRQRSLGHRLAGGKRCRVGALRHADQDLRDVGLGIGIRGRSALGQELVDIFFADLDALVDLTLAQPLDHDLVAHIGAKARVIDALGLEPFAQHRQRDLVLLRDVLHRAVQLGLIDLHATFARCRDHGALVDQRVQRLAPQLGLGRRALAGAAGFGLGTFDAALHLAGRHRLLVDNGGDVVAVAHATCLRLGQGHGAQQRQHHDGERSGGRAEGVGHGTDQGTGHGTEAPVSRSSIGEELLPRSSRSRR